MSWASWLCVWFLASCAVTGLWGWLRYLQTKHRNDRL